MFPSRIGADGALPFLPISNLYNFVSLLLDRLVGSRMFYSECYCWNKRDLYSFIIPTCLFGYQEL